VDEDRRRGAAGGDDQRGDVAKVLAAAAVQGVIFSHARRGRPLRRKGWRYLTGAWPGEKRPDPTTEHEAALGERRQLILEAPEVARQQRVERPPRRPSRRTQR
jgi:hypothetical protein